MTSKPVAMITGASRGLGRAMLRELLTAGWDAIGTYNTSQHEAAAAAAEGSEAGGAVTFLQVDLTDPKALLGLTARVEDTLDADFDGRRLRALINNAGTGALAPFADTTVEQFDTMTALNIRAPFFLTQRLSGLFTNPASVLNVSTALTRGVVPGGSAYAATKGAVEVLTRYQAAELAPRGVRVNTLMGGAAETDFADGAMHRADIRQLAAETIALGRIAQPGDIAATVPAVLSGHFTWATGGIIDVSGGQSL